MIRVVPLSLVDDLWPACSGYLEEALKVHPFLSLTDLRWLIDAGRADLIIDADKRVLCAAVMERVNYPSAIVANVVALGGEVGYMAKGLNSLLDFCECWAVRQGCQYFGMLGRPGWTQFVTSRGGQSLKLVQAWKQLEIPCQAAG